MAAIENRPASLKAALTLQPIEVFASYRPDRSEGTPGFGVTGGIS